MESFEGLLAETNKNKEKKCFLGAFEISSILEFFQ